MAKIAISGYYGFKNTGDEAVLYSMIESLRQLDPGLQIVVFSNDPQCTAKTYGVEAVNRWRLIHVIQALRESSLLISGGGSLLQDVTGQKSVFYYLGIIKLARLLGKPVMFYAQGVGPLAMSLSRKLVGRVIDDVQLATVRDERSAELLRQLGVKKPLLEVTADPVFALRPRSLSLPDGRQLLKSAGVDLHKPLIGCALREWQGLEEFKKSTARVAEILMERGYRVVFLPFHFPEDVAVGRDIARRMKHDPVNLKQQHSVPEMLAMVGEFEMVIGMRLHALIMAAVQGVPFVAISYDPKVDALSKVTEQIVAGKVETINTDKLLKAVDTILERRELFHSKLTVVSGQLSELACVNARKALEMAIKGR